MKRAFLAGATGLAVLVGLLGATSEARAQDRSGALEGRHHKFESPQNFAFELRFSPYRPDIDGDPALHGTAPYQRTFGTMARLMIAAEMDWQALRIPHLGTFGPGISVGYTSMAALAFLQSPPSPPNTLSGENTNLDIFPFYLVAVFRADVVTHELHIPLVPYVKAGVGYALWRAYNDGGTSQSKGVNGKGHSYGTQTALGVALHLNVFDEYSARNLDNTMGVNNTYLFWEYYSSDLTSFGSSTALRVGNSSWAAGLAFEF